jgi:uncharacterized membrane protein
MTTITAEFRAERERVHSTNGHVPAKRTPVLVILAGVVATVARFAARRLPRWSQVRTTVLAVAGFGCLVVGAFQLATWAGWIALGASLLVTELLTASDGT